MKLYRITDWDRHFEMRDTKRIDGPMKWIPVPTKTDGLGFARIRQHKRAADLLAAWYLMLGIAAKQPKGQRGLLVRDGIPLTADDLELMTGFPVSIFTLALDFFSQPSSGWLLAADVASDAATCGINAATCGKIGIEDRTGQDRTREDGRTVGTVPASDSEYLAELSVNEAYRGINVPQEFAKMRAWCGANKKQPTRRRFVNWLNRAERPMQPNSAYRAPIADGPANWRVTLRRLYPDSTFDAAWGSLPESTRREIQQAG